MTNLISIVGYLGSGKTLFSTYLASKMKRTIYCNYKLNLPNYKPLDLVDIIDIEPHCNIIIDEAYTWIDSRVSGRGVNRYCSYVILQSRKTYTDIIVTAQMFSTLDLRFRKMSNIIIECQSIGKQIYKDMIVPKRFHYKILNREKGTISHKELSFKSAIPYFKLFNTYEVINSSEKYQLEYHLIANDPKQLKKKIISISNFIKDDINEITHPTVKFALLSNEIPLQYEPYVYAYLSGKTNIRDDDSN